MYSAPSWIFTVKNLTGLNLVTPPAPRPWIKNIHTIPDSYSVFKNFHSEEWIQNMRIRMPHSPDTVDGSRFRWKVADSKISWYVWTGNQSTNIQNQIWWKLFWTLDVSEFTRIYSCLAEDKILQSIAFCVKTNLFHEISRRHLKIADIFTRQRSIRK